MATLSAESCCCVAEVVPQVPQTGQKKVCYLNDRDVEKIAKRKVPGDEFKITSWSLTPVEERKGFLGQYYKLSITVKAEGTSKSFKFFAKTPPPRHSQQYEFLLRYDTFQKEIIAYTEMMPRMGTGAGPKWLVEHYLSKKNLIIVLEDATIDGYATPDKYVPFDAKHCAWVLKTLSKLHSRSLILDEKLRRGAGKTIKDLYGPLLDEVLFVEDDERSMKILSSCIKGSCAVVDLIEGLNDDERLFLKNRIDEWGRALPQLLKPSEKIRNVICHRDIWANNIMFKYDSSGEPVGCYLVDFQFLRYCPPALDFMFFLYLATDRKTREDHFEDLLKLYHDEFAKELALENWNVEDYLPLTAFRKSCIDARPIALSYAVQNLQIQLISSQANDKYFMGPREQLEKILYSDGRTELVTDQFQTVPAYKARLSEVVLEIKHCVQAGPLLAL
ncbi:hypothetical protein KM043_006987 [Ampulex compressa]|nr:hypothetical protein KM043_006987 [Ampulex compressa]